MYVSYLCTSNTSCGCLECILSGPLNWQDAGTEACPWPQIICSAKIQNSGPLNLVVQNQGTIVTHCRWQGDITTTKTQSCYQATRTVQDQCRKAFSVQWSHLSPWDVLITRQKSFYIPDTTLSDLWPLSSFTEEPTGGRLWWGRRLLSVSFFYFKCMLDNPDARINSTNLRLQQYLLCCIWPH